MLGLFLLLNIIPPESVDVSNDLCIDLDCESGLENIEDYDDLLSNAELIKDKSTRFFPKLEIKYYYDFIDSAYTEKNFHALYLLLNWSL